MFPPRPVLIRFVMEIRPCNLWFRIKDMYMARLFSLWENAAVNGPEMLCFCIGGGKSGWPYFISNDLFDFTLQFILKLTAFVFVLCC